MADPSRAVAMRCLIVVLALSWVSSIIAHAQPQNLPRVGVLDLTSANLSSAICRQLSDQLRTELASSGRLEVVEREQTDAALQEQGSQQAGKLATERIVHVGHLIAAHKMVAGTVGRVGDVCTISLRLIDVATGALQRTAVNDCECEVQELLTRIIPQMAAELGGVAAVVTELPEDGGGVGTLSIGSTPDSADVTIDGRPRGTTPVLLSEIASGPHAVRVTSPDHLPWVDEVVVVNESVAVPVTLQPCGYLTVQVEPSDATVLLLSCFFLAGGGAAESHS